MLCRRCPCHPEPITLGNYRNEELEVVAGGLQDYGYLFSNCMELTVEVSCDKKPHSRTLGTHWRNNYHAIIATIGAVDGGVKGLVVDKAGRPVEGASVEVEGIDKKTVTNKRGEFWRLLLPGTYTLCVSKTAAVPMYLCEKVEVVVTSDLGEGAMVVTLVMEEAKIIPHLTTSRGGQSG